MSARTESPSRRSSLRAKLMLLLGSSLVILCTAELVLRWQFSDLIGAQLASRERGIEADRSILCIGDSYTFGLYYRQEESFPGRLERMIERRGGAEAPRWAVLNAGIPAQNTAQMAAALPAQLRDFAPEVVVVLAGHNNRWNLADPGRRSAVGEWFDGLVLVRLCKIAATAPDDQRGRDRITSWGAEEVGVQGAGGVTQIEIDKTADRRSDQAVYESCKRDFETIARTCARQDISVVFASYPSPEPNYQAPSDAARDVAKEQGQTFVDYRALFGKALEHRPYHEILIPGDRHPTDRGHFLMASALFDSLVQLGVIDEAGAASSGEEESLYPVRLAIEGQVSYRISGPPEAEYQVVVARSGEPPIQFGSRTVPVAQDDLFARFSEEPTFQGSFDGEGSAEISIPALLRGQQHRAVVVAFYDLRLRTPDLMVRGISEGVQYTP